MYNSSTFIPPYTCSRLGQIDSATKSCLSVNENKNN